MPLFGASSGHPVYVLDTEAAWRLLANACPGFGRSNDADELDSADGAYIWVAALARYLVRELAAGRTTEMAAACTAAETILAEGDQDAQTFANNGFLEDITNGHLWSRVGLSRETLLPFVGPLGRQNPWVMNIEHGYEP